MRGTTLAWLAFLAAATYRYEKDPANTATLPPPSIYLGSAVIYSLLGLAAGPAPGPAAAFGWALVVAALTTGALLPGGPGSNVTPGKRIRSGTGKTLRSAPTTPAGPVGPGL